MRWPEEVIQAATSGQSESGRRSDVKRIAKDIVNCRLDKANALVVVVHNSKKSFEMTCEFCTVGGSS